MAAMDVQLQVRAVLAPTAGNRTPPSEMSEHPLAALIDAPQFLLQISEELVARLRAGPDARVTFSTDRCDVELTYETAADAVAMRQELDPDTMLLVLTIHPPAQTYTAPVGGEEELMLLPPGLQAAAQAARKAVGEMGLYELFQLLDPLSALSETYGPWLHDLKTLQRELAELPLPLRQQLEETARAEARQIQDGTDGLGLQAAESNVSRLLEVPAVPPEAWYPEMTASSAREPAVPSAPPPEGEAPAAPADFSVPLAAERPPVELPSALAAVAAPSEPQRDIQGPQSAAQFQPPAREPVVVQTFRMRSSSSLEQPVEAPSPAEAGPRIARVIRREPPPPAQQSREMELQKELQELQTKGTWERMRQEEAMVILQRQVRELQERLDRKTSEAEELKVELAQRAAENDVLKGQGTHFLQGQVLKLQERLDRKTSEAEELKVELAQKSAENDVLKGQGTHFLQGQVLKLQAELAQKTVEHEQLKAEVDAKTVEARSAKVRSTMSTKQAEEKFREMEETQDKLRQELRQALSSKEVFEKAYHSKIKELGELKKGNAQLQEQLEELQPLLDQRSRLDYAAHPIVDLPRADTVAPNNATTEELLEELQPLLDRRSLDYEEHSIVDLPPTDTMAPNNAATEAATPDPATEPASAIEITRAYPALEAATPDPATEPASAIEITRAYPALEAPSPLLLVTMEVPVAAVAPAEEPEADKEPAAASMEEEPTEPEERVQAAAPPCSVAAAAKGDVVDYQDLEPFLDHKVNHFTAGHVSSDFDALGRRSGRIVHLGGFRVPVTESLAESYSITLPITFKNIGHERWPATVVLERVEGTLAIEYPALAALAQGAKQTIHLDMKIPCRDTPGKETNSWALKDQVSGHLLGVALHLDVSWEEEAESEEL